MQWPTRAGKTAGMERAPIGDGTEIFEPRRRSVPGSKRSDNGSVDLVASTSQVDQAAPLRHGHTTWYGKLVRREGPLLGLLATGTGMVVLNQYIADQDIADGSVQVLAWVKYAAIYCAAYAIARGEPATAKHTAEQYTLLAMIGLLDVFAFAANCAGIAFCGATTAALVLAGVQQLFTAALSYFLLGRKLHLQQLTGVAIVCVGLAVQGMAPEQATAAGLTTPAGLAPAGVVSKAVGIMLILLAALAYSFLQVSYDLLVRSEGPTPTHSEVMFYTAKIGLGLNTMYQLMWTVPQWNKLVTTHMANNNTSCWFAAGLLITFGVMFHIHSFVQGLVFRIEGAVGVALVNAIRGSTVSLLMGTLFCSSATPARCLHAWTGASAAVQTAGGLTWLTAGRKRSRKLIRRDTTRLQVFIAQPSFRQAVMKTTSFRQVDKA